MSNNALKWKYFTLAIVLLALLTVSCTDDFDDDFYNSCTLPSIVLEAKQLLENNNVEMSLLNMEKAYQCGHDNCSHSSRKSAENFTIDWKGYRTKTESNGEIVTYVPIKHEQQNAFSFYTEDGRATANMRQVYSTLILHQCVNDDDIEMMVGTYLYGRDMKEKDVKRMGLDFESANFNGYFIASNIDGTMINGRCFENGEFKFQFKQNPVAPKDRKNKEESADSTNNHRHTNHLFLNLNHINSSNKTKAIINQDPEWLMTHCSFCKKLYTECDCVVIDGNNTCEYCETQKTNGRCSYACSICNECTVNPNHSHYNGGYSGGGSTGGSTGGGNTGGGNTGGGNTGGGGGGGGGGGSYSGPNPDPQPQPDPAPTDNHTFTQTIFKTASDNAYDKIAAEHPSDPACNFGVQEVSRQLFGKVLEELEGRANDIYNNLEASQKWQKISYTEANHYANLGYLVIAAWNSGSAEMGHVDTILPGHTGSEWNNIYVMDTGWSPWTNTYGQSGNPRSKEQIITYSFSKAKRTSERFGIYYYK